MAEKKLRTIVVDTLGATIEQMYMTQSQSPTFDDWMDWGKDIWSFITYLKRKGFNIVMVLGEPGTGKSTAMRTLQTGTNIWFNSDDKFPVWEGGAKEYGTTNNPKRPFHVIPKSYAEMKVVIDHLEKGDQFEKFKVAFLLGHPEDYTAANNIKRRRLQVLGKVATKRRLEGRMETTLYSNVKVIGKKRIFELTTQNSGTDTARSPMGVFEDSIEPDFDFIYEKLKTFYNGE